MDGVSAKERRRIYPRFQILTLPPDPRRKSVNVVILEQTAPRGPLDVVCVNPCAEKGRAQPDGSCRHTEIVMNQIKPWWRKRARPVQAGEARQPGAAGAGRVS